MAIEVTSSALAAMRAAAAAAYPEEACGILLGEGARVEALQPAANVHPTPQTHFEIDPQALIDAHREARGGGPKVMGYFHSHPRGPAAPSATDAAMAAKDGSVWAICGAVSNETGAAQDVLFYRAGEGGFAELSMTVIES